MCFSQWEYRHSSTWSIYIFTLFSPWFICQSVIFDVVLNIAGPGDLSGSTVGIMTNRWQLNFKLLCKYILKKNGLLRMCFSQSEYRHRSTWNIYIFSPWFICQSVWNTGAPLKTYIGTKVLHRRLADLASPVGSHEWLVFIFQLLPDPPRLFLGVAHTVRAPTGGPQVC